MRALTVRPGDPDSLSVEEFADPAPTDDGILVETIAVGVCGTDRDVLDGDLGYPEKGKDRLVIGHEAVGRVIEAPAEIGLQTGDLVVPIVRRPDPLPCPNCAVGEWDMCRNGRFTEAGIRGLDGYAADRFVLPAGFAVRVDARLGELGVLVEPASVVAKAWETILHIGTRSRWSPDRVLVTGAGPVGLLAALLATRYAIEVHVLDQVAGGPKPRLVRDLGAVYHSEGLRHVEGDFDVVVECTGSPGLALAVAGHLGPNGVACQTGVFPEGDVSVSSDPMRDLVLKNQTSFGTVNANRRHYEEAARVLAETDRSWLGRMVDRRLTVDRSADAYRRGRDDVKTVIEFE